jgi:hypothetical protein
MAWPGGQVIGWNLNHAGNGRTMPLDQHPQHFLDAVERRTHDAAVCQNTNPHFVAFATIYVIGATSECAIFPLRWTAWTPPPCIARRC